MVSRVNGIPSIAEFERKGSKSKQVRQNKIDKSNKDKFTKERRVLEMAQNPRTKVYYFKVQKG